MCACRSIYVRKYEVLLGKGSRLVEDEDKKKEVEDEVRGSIEA